MAAAAAAVAPTPDANGAGPACFPFLFEGDVDRLGQHFVRCIHLGQWELVSGVLCPSPSLAPPTPSVPRPARISHLAHARLLCSLCVVPGGACLDNLCQVAKCGAVSHRWLVSTTGLSRSVGGDLPPPPPTVVGLHSAHPRLLTLIWYYNAYCISGSCNDPGARHIRR